MKAESERTHRAIADEGKRASRFVSSVFPESDLTAKIIEAALTVHNSLGAGFLEKVYENALALELRRGGILSSTTRSHCELSRSSCGRLLRGSDRRQSCNR